MDKILAHLHHLCEILRDAVVRSTQKGIAQLKGKPILRRHFFSFVASKWAENWEKDAKILGLEREWGERKKKQIRIFSASF